VYRRYYIENIKHFFGQKRRKKSTNSRKVNEKDKKGNIRMKSTTTKTDLAALKR
jgi:hypothetical protein